MKNFTYSLIVMLVIQTVWADKVVLLEGHKESIEARTDFMSSATNEIRAQYYTIKNDVIANGGLAILRDVAMRKPDVRVRIIVDSFNNDMQRDTMAAFLSDNQGAPLNNVEIKEYNTFKWYAPWRYTKRMHDKALIIDNNVLISGGRNIANGYFGLNNKKKPQHAALEDTDILVFQSHAIDEAAQYFDDLWNSPFVKTVKLGTMATESLTDSYCKKSVLTHDKQYSAQITACENNRLKNLKLINQQRKELNSLANTYANRKITKAEALKKWLYNKDAIQTGKIDYIYDNPVGQKHNLEKPKALENNIAKQLYAAVKTAKKSVVIVTPYLVITPEQEALFAELQARKVRVRIFTNGINSNDVTPAHVGYLNTRELALKHGAQIWEYNGPDSLHAKMVIIDRKKMFIGSFNWDFRSQNLNREVGIVAELESDNAIDVEKTDIFAKMARIYARSTKLGDTRRLNHEIGEDGEFDDDDLENLAYEIRKGNKSVLLWQVIYPLIKTQL